MIISGSISAGVDISSCNSRSFVLQLCKVWIARLAPTRTCLVILFVLLLFVHRPIWLCHVIWVSKLKYGTHPLCQFRFRAQMHGRSVCLKQPAEPILMQVATSFGARDMPLINDCLLHCATWNCRWENRSPCSRETVFVVSSGPISIIPVLFGNQHWSFVLQLEERRAYHYILSQNRAE